MQPYSKDPMPPRPSATAHREFVRVLGLITNVLDTPVTSEGAEATYKSRLDFVQPYIRALKEYFDHESAAEDRAQAFAGHNIPNWVSSGNTECAQIAMMAHELGQHAKLLRVCTLEAKATYAQRQAVRAASLALARIALELEATFGVAPLVPERARR